MNAKHLEDDQVQFTLNHSVLVTGSFQSRVDTSGLSFVGIISHLDAKHGSKVLGFDITIFLSDKGFEISGHYSMDVYRECGNDILVLNSNSLDDVGGLIKGAKFLEDQLRYTLCRFNKKKASMTDKDLSSLVNGLTASIIIGGSDLRSEVSALGVMALQSQGRNDLVCRVLADKSVQKELASKSLGRHTIRYQLANQ